MLRLLALSLKKHTQYSEGSFCVHFASMPDHKVKCIAFAAQYANRLPRTMIIPFDKLNLNLKRRQQFEDLRTSCEQPHKNMYKFVKRLVRTGPRSCEYVSHPMLSFLQEMTSFADGVDIIDPADENAEYWGYCCPEDDVEWYSSSSVHLIRNCCDPEECLNILMKMKKLPNGQEIEVTEGFLVVEDGSVGLAICQDMEDERLKNKSK